MKMKTTVRLFLALLCLLLALPTASAETRQGVIALEGMEEIIEETLFESPEGFSFWYANDGLEADFGTVDHIEGVVVANSYSDDYMVLSRISEEEAVEYAESLGVDIKEQSAASRVQVNVQEELRDGRIYFLTLLAENGQYLRADGAYSLEAAEGIAKYFQRVLDSVEWTAE